MTDEELQALRTRCDAAATDAIAKDALRQTAHADLVAKLAAFNAKTVTRPQYAQTRADYEIVSSAYDMAIATYRNLAAQVRAEEVRRANLPKA